MSEDRHRALIAILESKFDFFEPDKRVIEVAPMRGLEKVFKAIPGMDYTSFDLMRHAMEKGDITQMRFDSNSADYFLCFHVLEHIPEEKKALAEIRRVLKPGGNVVLQVPLDESLAESYEYDAPDPREVDHVRRYGRDFGERIGRHGFEVTSVSVADFLDEEAISYHGLCRDAVYFARKPE